MNFTSTLIDTLNPELFRSTENNLIEIENKDKTENKTDAPLKIIQPSTIEILSTLLNPIKLIPTEGGLLRDWRGLAELVGISVEQIVSLDSKANPTSELLKLWAKEEPRNISDLKASLAVIDRFDIFDDITPLLENDIAHYWSQKDAITGPPASIPVSVSLRNDSDILTIGDTHGTHVSHYDAFILYAEEDSDFAMKIVDKMENEYNLKICVKDRDLLGGTMFEHEIIGRIIEERCNRLLAIFSPNFLKSQANQFLVSYAQALALERRQRKIIPCMYIRCDLPPSVRYSFCLDYNRSGKLWNFWDKLAQSVRTNTSSAIDVPNSKRSTNSSSQAMSLPANVSYENLGQPQSLDKSDSKSLLGSSYDWWVASKTKQAAYSASDSGLEDNFDTLSLSSTAPLESTTSSPKTQGIKLRSLKKLKKFMNPSKNKNKGEKESNAVLN